MFWTPHFSFGLEILVGFHALNILCGGQVDAKRPLTVEGRAEMGVGVVTPWKNLEILNAKFHKLMHLKLWKFIHYDRESLTISTLFQAQIATNRLTQYTISWSNTVL